MIDYISIANTLSKLDKEYSSCKDIQMSILYSKLAVLELCGWIETSIDDMLYNYIDEHIIDNSCKDKIKQIIKRNNGFNYETNLFNLFCSVLGINNLENILYALTDSEFQYLKSITYIYSQDRNKAAHTDTPNGTTRRYNSPSNVLHDYGLLKPTLEHIEREVINMPL